MLNEGNDFFEKLIGKRIKIFLKNGYKYEGKLESCGWGFIQIFDFLTRYSKILRIEDIADAEILEGKQ